MSLKPPRSATGDELMDVHEVAERLGLTAQTVRLKIRSGELPGFRLGKRGSSLRVSRKELEDWLFEEDS